MKVQIIDVIKTVETDLNRWVFPDYPQPSTAILNENDPIPMAKVPRIEYERRVETFRINEKLIHYVFKDKTLNELIEAMIFQQTTDRINIENANKKNKKIEKELEQIKAHKFLYKLILFFDKFRK